MASSRVQKTSKLRTFVRVAATAVLALVTTLVLIGLVYQSLATSRDLHRNPPPGKVVDVEGLSLHYLNRGDDGPVVVFDSPTGASSMGWALVEPEVAKFGRTVAWDRPGYGWSDPGPRPQTSGRLVDQLHGLLEESGAPKPYVLVGSSFGACNVRLFAFRYPEEVAGLVLVDPAHEDQFERTPVPPLPSVWTLRLFQVASRLGVMRLADMPVDIAGMNVLPNELQAPALAVGLRSTAVDAIVAETAAIEQGFAEVRQARISAGEHPLGDLPLIVLTRREKTPPVGDEVALYDLWVRLHEELAAESTRGRQIFVPDSGHFIAVDQPAAVVKAIREVVDMARDGNRIPATKDESEIQEPGVEPNARTDEN